MNKVGLAIPDIILDAPQPDPDLWQNENTIWQNATRLWNVNNLITDIDYQRLDLFEDEQIKLTQTIQDIKDIEKVFTDFSQSFNLPASKINNRLFRHYYRTDIQLTTFSDEVFNANTKLTARLELNYRPFRQGYIVLNQVKLKNNQPSSYNITFFGETITLKDRLKDRKLSSLNFSQYNHNYNVSTVKEGLETFVTTLNGTTTSTAHIIYPLISHTQRFIYDSTAQGVLTTQARSDKTRNLYAPSSGASQSTSGSGDTERVGTTKGLQFNDLKPAIRVIDILDAIENDADIDLQFTTDFFTTSGYFGDLYMWLHRNKGDIGVTPTGSTDVNTILVDTIQSFTGDTTLFFNDNGVANFIPTFVGGVFTFRVAQSGVGDNVDTEEMSINWTITSSDTSKNFTARIKDFTTGEPIVSQEYGNTNPLSISAGFSAPDIDGSLVENKVVFEIETTETSLPLTFTMTFTKTLTSTDITGQPDVFTFAVTPGVISPSSLVDTIVVSEQIPDITIVNFLTGLFKMFNLTAFIESDVSSADYGKVRVRTLDSFYASGTSRNITEFVDTSQGESGFSVPFNDIEFKFEEPKTFAAFFFDKINGREYASAKASTTQNSGRDPRLNRGQDYRIKLPFEKMFFERLINVNNNANTGIGFGYFVDNDQNPTIAKPLLFLRETTSSERIQIFDGGGAGTPASIQSYNRPTNFRPGTETRVISVSASESSNFTFEFINGTTFETTTGSVAPGAGTTITPVVTGSFVETSTPASASNITINTTTLTTGQTINFSTEINTFNNSIDANTLFNTFYKTYIADVFSSSRRLVKVNAILPQSFLMNYKLSDTIVINDVEFLINKISTNLQTGKSTLELLNKVS